MYSHNLTSDDNGHLTLHGIDLFELANNYGTPLFVFDENKLEENFKRFSSAFEQAYPKNMICYSTKTNNNLAISNLLRKKGASTEVASELDLHVALKAGFFGSKMIYDGPFKPAGVLKKAIQNKLLLVNVESFQEMDRLNSIAKEMGVTQAIGLRINPFKRSSFFKSLSPNKLLDGGYCYPSCRFGFALKEIQKAFYYAQKMENLSLECLMTHPYQGAPHLLLPLMKEAHEKFGFEIKYLNVGGGFDPDITGYTSDFLLMFDFLKRKLRLKSALDKRKAIPSIESIAESLARNITQNLGNLPEPTLITEPGRFIVGSSGMLLSRVDQIKTAGGYKWVLVDAGTNIMPIIHERRTVLIANRATESATELVNIVGPLLYPKDFISIKQNVPKIMENDVIAVLDCGAYSLSSSTQFLYPRPAAVMINSNKEVNIIRKRETPEDVFTKDVIF